MLSGTFALLQRSLRMESRRLRSHLIRLIFSSLIFLSLAWSHATSLRFSAPGLKFFQAITFLNLAFITLAGFGFFATAITEEKEEGTLGLLKMAGISRAGILLGKSTSRLVSAMLLLFAQFPFTLLAITLGGVTFQQILAAYSALLAYMILVANLAMFFSVSSKRSSTASLLSAIGVAVFVVGAPICQYVLSWLVAVGRISATHWMTERTTSLLEWLWDASIVERIQIILLTGFDESWFSVQVKSNLIEAGVFFILSWALFDLFTREPGLQSPVRGLFAKPSVRLRRLARLGVGRAWSHPLIWKDFHFTAGGKSYFGIKLVVYGLMVPTYGFLYELIVGDFPWDFLGRGLMAAMAVTMALEGIVYATRIFHDELKWNTLANMMLLPLSTARIAYSKAAGCLLGLIPAALYFIIGACMDPELFFNAFSDPWVWTGLLLFAILLHLTVLLSLVVKWGALPLAIGALCLLTTCGISWIAVFPILVVHQITGAQEATIMPIVYFGVFIVAVFQVLVYLQLEIAAGK